MRIYYLTQPGHAILHRLDTEGLDMPSHVVTVHGSDWYGARARAFRHAAEQGERRCLVMVGHCQLMRVHRSRSDPRGGTPETIDPVSRGPLHDHGALLYLDRLLRQYVGAVMVPPLGAIRQLPAGWARDTPTIPMVGAYSIAAVMSVPHVGPALGYNLASAGYCVVTLGDYAYTQHGPTVMDEYGTTTTWKKAYEQAIQAYL